MLLDFFYLFKEICCAYTWCCFIPNFVANIWLKYRFEYVNPNKTNKTLDFLLMQIVCTPNYFQILLMDTWICMSEILLFRKKLLGVLCYILILHVNKCTFYWMEFCFLQVLFEYGVIWVDFKIILFNQWNDMHIGWFLCKIFARSIFLCLDILFYTLVNYSFLWMFNLSFFHFYIDNNW